MVASRTIQSQRAATDGLRAPKESGAGWTFGGLGSVVLLGFGWWLRDEGYLRAESGLGYQLGIAGLTAMLLVIVYSARKRLRSCAWLGPLPFWFRVHEVFGIVGPIAILFHCNFHLGSFNSNLALFVTMIVAGSGVAGRFIYGKVHFGLDGWRSDLERLRVRLTQDNGELRPLLEVFPEALAPLERFQERLSRSPRSSLSAVLRLLTLRPRGRRVRRRALALLDPALYEERQAVAAYVAGVSRVARFAAYERLFRLWHTLHVPLFFVLLGTVALHVVAVHMY